MRVFAICILFLFGSLSNSLARAESGMHYRIEKVGQPRAVGASVPVAVMPVLNSDKAKIELTKEEQSNPHIQKLIDFIFDEKNQKRIEAKFAKSGIKMNLVATVLQWQKDHPKMTTTQMALSLGVLEQGGRSALTLVDKDGKSVRSVMSPTVCSKISGHADYMVNRYAQSHDNYATRAAGLGGVSEIVKETFDGTYDIIEAAQFCGNWTSNTHRPEMLSEHGAFCYDMRMAKDGKWFCGGLFTDTVVR